jgi:diaminopimelate decarboxylase/aspartate kinase
LISIESLGMWQEVGFLADLFACFKNHGLSIDLVSTSETNVTVSIDPLTNSLHPSSMSAFMHDLEQFGKVQIITPCAVVSLVGRNIRSILHQLGPALKVFEEQKVYLVSQAASDLNLTFVVREDEAGKLLQELHHLLFDNLGADPTFGPSWQDVFVQSKNHATTHHELWWQKKRNQLLKLAGAHSPLYVYDQETLKKSATQLQSLKAIDQLFFAVKANDNEDILRTFFDLGLNFECVSIGEIERIFGLFPAIKPNRVLFTPNFAPKAEYQAVMAKGCHITLDNLYPLEKWPELFANQNVILRLDPGEGRGHHQHVKTAGEQSKFGIYRHEIGKAQNLIQKCGAKVIGLHAHAGSGINRAEHWADIAHFLVQAAEQFTDVQVLNLGGGLFVPSQIYDDSLDLNKLDAALLNIRQAHPQFQFWLEPGRYLVANAGVLLATVTQLKDKNESHFVGIDAGMNSLIRPALYGAYHHIVNLSRIDDAVAMVANVVGPICESGDTLGFNRKLPNTQEGDVLLIATAGAYGRVMSSQYNRREPASEHFLKA